MKDNILKSYFAKHHPETGQFYRVKTPSATAFIACGNAATSEAWQLAPPFFDLLLTDPPFGVAQGRKAAMLNKVDGGNRITTTMENDANFSEETLLNVFEIVKNRLHRGAGFYVFGPPGADLCRIPAVLRQAGLPPRHSLIWVKNRFVISWADYKYQHEMIFYGWRKGAKHRWYGPRNAASVIRHSAVTRNRFHPTQKPVGLLKMLIENSTQPNDWIIDPFAGSCSTAIAALESKRNVYCIEASPLFAAAAIERMMQAGYKVTKL